MTRPLRVLFVCTANICRSPFMELVARELAGDGLEVSSAGTHGYADHAMDAQMAAGLVDREIAHEAFRSRRLTPELVAEADVVLTAEAAHRRFVLEQQPHAAGKVFTLGQFAAAAQQAEGVTGRELLQRLASAGSAADASLDVGDPFRRGPERAAECADQIESLLRVAVPALTGSERIGAWSS
ncbi:MAG TPA: hypothetical protein VD814_00480 [Nocardioides sp.]|nr:hypothetical protein [Nocardioides sp.]